MVGGEALRGRSVVGSHVAWVYVYDDLDSPLKPKWHIVTMGVLRGW
jgi:hypothetical protein